MRKRTLYLSWGSHPWARTGTVCGTASCTCWQSVQRDRAESWAAPWRTGLSAQYHHRPLHHHRPLRFRLLQTPPSPSKDTSSAPGSARLHRTNTHTRAHPRPGASCCKTHTVPCRRSVRGWGGGLPPCNYLYSKSKCKNTPGSTVYTYTHTYASTKLTATTPQFTATELFLRNYKALFLCLKYTSSDSTLCSTQLTPSLFFSLLYSHTHTLPFIILSWKKQHTLSLLHRYSSLLSLEVLSLPAFAFSFPLPVSFSSCL